MRKCTSTGLSMLPLPTSRNNKGRRTRWNHLLRQVETRLITETTPFSDGSWEPNSGQIMALLTFLRFLRVFEAVRSPKKASKAIFRLPATTPCWGGSRDQDAVLQSCSPPPSMLARTMSWRGRHPAHVNGELTSYRVIRRKGAYALRCVGFTDKLLKCSKTDQRPKTASLQSTVPSTLSSVLAPWLPSKPALVFSWPITTSFLGRLQYSTFARDLSSTGRWRRHPGVAFRSTTLCVAFSSSTIGNKHSQLPLMEMPRDGAGGGWAGPTLRPDLAPAKQSTTGPDVPCVTRHVLSVT